jgi:hypothetical protein
LTRRPARHRLPLPVTELGELRVHHPPQDEAAFDMVERHRQLPHIGANAHQPLAVDDGTHVVEDCALDQGWAHRRQRHGDQAASRGADENCLVDAGGGEHVKRIVGLDTNVVAAPVAAPFRVAAAAIVESQDAARHAPAAGEMEAELMEVARRARQARQADDG